MMLAHLLLQADAHLVRSAPSCVAPLSVSVIGVLN